MADDRKRISEINTITTDAADNYLLVVENPTTGESEQCSIDTLKDTAFGSAAALDAGMEDGQVPVLEIDDDYNVALPAVSASQLTDFPAGMNEGDLAIHVAIDVDAAPFGRGLQIGIAGVPTTVLVDFSTDQDNAGFILADAVTIEEQAHGIFWSRESGETAFAALADLVDIFADVSMALSAPEIIVSGDTDNEISVIFPTSGLGVDTGGAKLHNVRNINYKPITGNVAFNALDFGYAHMVALTLMEDMAITSFENIQEVPDGAVEDHTEFLLTVAQGYPGEWKITQWPANVIWLNGAAPDFSGMAEGEKRLIHFYYDQLNMYGWYQPFYYEIKQAYEANDDTNAFTDDEKTKLGLISASLPIDLDSITLSGLSNQFFLVGEWDASTGSFPFFEYLYGGLQVGSVFRVSVTGTVDGVSFFVGDLLVAIAGDPLENTYVDNWLRIRGNNTANSVKSFGAVGDGVTDDTSAVQIALDAAAGAFDLYFPAGIYMIDAESGGISIPSNTTLRLDGNAELKCIINDATAYQIIRIGINAENSGEAQTRENIKIIGGKITGDKEDHTGVTGEAGHCIYIRNCNNVLIEDVEITEAWGDGIYLGNSQGAYRGQDTSPRNIIIRGGNITDNGRNNVSVVCGENILVDGPELARADRTLPMAGIDVENTETGTITKNVKIVNCNIHDNSGYGVMTIDSGAGDTENAIVSTNNIYANLLGGVITKATTATREIKIIDNDIFGNIGNQVTLNGELAGSLEGNITIRGNLIGFGVDNGILGHGVHIYGTNVWATVIRENRILNNPRHGIYVDGTSVVDELLIGDNVINGNSQLADVTYNNIFIENSVHYCNIYNNLIREDVFSELTNGAAYGIRVDDNEKCYIHGNDVAAGGKTGNILVANRRTPANITNHYVWDNKGYRTETVIRSDTFLVDAIATLSFNVPHGLAVTPDISEVSVSLIPGILTNNTVVATAWAVSTDATNVACIVNVTDPSGNGGNTMRLVVKINNVKPS
jgi:hypothetical protein